MRQLRIVTQVTDRTSTSARAYFNEVSLIPMISSEREAELSAIILAGGEGAQAAKDELVRANLRFVISVAKQYQGFGVDLMDLINDGNQGLIKAAEVYDATTGFKFISYAVWWIRQTIFQSIIDQGKTVRIPVHRYNVQRKIERAQLALEGKLGRTATPEEVSQETGIMQHHVEENFVAYGMASLDAPAASADPDSPALLDFVTSSAPTKDKESIAIDLQRVLSKLPSRNRRILEMYFGIGLPDSKTLQEIASEMGMSRERVRQLRDASLRHLRKNSSAKLLKQYL